MSIVTLVSGGLDSTVMAVLAQEEGLTQFPLFIDYGQLGRDKEFQACQMNFKRYGLPEPKVAALNGYGSLLSSGLTDSKKHIYKEAFLPCRNLMFLTVGAAYAFQCGATAVGIGLLDEAFSLFPDQTKSFLADAEALLSKALGKSIRVITPLITFSKADVLKIAKAKSITQTYSCHAGTDSPCGQCVACREYIGLEV
ncbi:MAG TPA: 7-cyano-7-deazaguanine synthase [Nitrospira sp.]|nr:7-cyano-7-deazaguanine synthase [Nitrospira sp.]HBR51974.1 7-cyano-7-deazaguanine synthase [Nitrospira sp.]